MIALLLGALLAQADAPPATEAPAVTEAPVSNETTVAPQVAEVKVEAPPEPVPLACARWRSPGLIEGPVFLGYAAADLTLGRRACPRSEVGVGFNFGAIIDTPNFYGNVSSQLLFFGAWAIDPKTELFATFAAIDWEYTVNAVISPAGYFSSPNLGDLTLGGSRQLYQTDSLAGALSLRVLLPTASNIPGTRNTGAELGHSVSLRATTWLEVHGYAGVGFTVGIGPAPLPAVTLVGMIGAALTPFSWFSLVVDLSGGLAGRSFFAPTAALRFRIFRLGIELAATRPLAGTARQDVIVGARLTWRI
ncbi:MAG: hypothetical protein IPJ65_18700 [Archangiaceae bacterium]|nr:hypothetical protein [Archangiaceae bacterium]